MKRLFIGIRIDGGEALRTMIRKLSNDLISERIRWVKYGNQHITLAFLGDTDENRIDEIVLSLSKATSFFKRFSIGLRGIGVFRSIADPRIIWLGIIDAGDLIDLRNKLVDILTDNGLYNDRGRFMAHVTIGRTRRISDRKLLEMIINKYGDSLMLRQPVNEVILFESILGPGGPVYNELFRAELGNN